MISWPNRSFYPPLIQFVKRVGREMPDFRAVRSEGLASSEALGKKTLGVGVLRMGAGGFS